MDDEKLRLGIEIMNLQSSVKGLQNLADNAAKSAANFDLLDKESEKTLAKLATDMKRLTGLTKSYSAIVKESIAVNKGLAIVSTEEARAANQLANAELTKARTTKMSEQADREAIKTTREKVKLMSDEIALANRKASAEARAAKQLATGGAYSQLTKELSAYTTKMKDAIAAGKLNDTALNAMANKYTRLQGNVTGVNAKFATLTGSIKETAGFTQMLSRSVASFIGNSLAMWLRNATRGMVEFGKEVSKAGITLDSLRNTMMAATGGWTTGGKEIQWLLNMSNKLGIAFGDVSGSYAKFMTSFTRSGGTMAQSEQIFEDMSTAMVSLHLPAEQMKNVYVALEQMANKGTVQAEELKRQLGNALPGAFELAAESMGVLPAKLMDMMKAGEAISKDFLPAFARTVKDVLGQSIGIAVDQFNAHMARLTTATTLLKMELGQGLNAALVPFVKLLTPAAMGLAELARFFNENAAAAATLKAILIPLGLALTSMTFSLVASTTAFISSQVAASAFFVAMGSGVKALIADAVALNASLGGLPLIIGTVATAVAGLGFYLSDTSKKAADVSSYMGMRGQIVELIKSIAGLDTSTKEGQETVSGFKEEFPTLTQYVLDTGKEFKNLTQAELENIAVLGVHDAKMRVASEKTAELASWQNTLSATWQVAWGNIAKWAKTTGQIILIISKVSEKAFQHLVQGLGSMITIIAKRIGQLGSFASSLGSKMGTSGIMLKTWGDNVKTISDVTANFGGKVKDTGENLNKLGTGIKDWYTDTAFGIDVTNKKIEISNNNAIKKLKEINKGAIGSVKALTQAQAAAVGLTGGDGESGKGRGKGRAGKTPETDWDKFNKEISAMEGNMKIRKLHGQSIDDLIPKYVKLKAQQDSINKSINDLSKTQKDAWTVYGQEISELESQIRVRKLNGQSVDDLIPRYVRLKTKQDEVNKSIQELIKPTDKLVTGWAALKEELKETEDKYKGMLSNSTSYTTAEIKQQQELMRGLKIQVQYNEALENSEDLMGMSNRAAGQLADTLVDDLFTPLKEGETIWGRFKDAGLSALKALTTDWVKNRVGLMSKGFQTAWGLNAKYGDDSLLGNLSASFTGLVQGAKKLPIEGTLYDTTDIASLTNTAQAIGNLNAQTARLASTAMSNLSPAISGATTAISAVTTPATLAASGIASMATATPVAAMGTGIMAASMSLLAPAVTSAAPAMVTMGAALAKIAANASKAAIAMADLAIATAANSVAGIPILGAILAPTAALATGAAIAAGGALVGAGIATGSVMAGAGNLIGGGLTGVGNLLSGGQTIKHAKGGVVSSPTTFPMSGGNIGVAGEAGTEVIAPARRMSNGDVGVGAVAPNVTINNYSNTAVEVIKRPNNDTEIRITELNAMLSSSRTNKGMASAQSRMQSRGKRIG